MLEYKEVQRISTTKELVKCICDKCGRDFKNERTESGHHVESAYVRLEDIHSFPGDYYSTSKEFDICSDCFTLHVIPAMLALGFTLHSRDEDGYD